MRARVLAPVLTVCVLVACSKREPETVAPCDAQPLANHIKQSPAAVLAAAADMVDGARPIADSTFEVAWQADAPRYLQERTDPAMLNAGILQLCDLIDDLPAAKRAGAAAGIDSWIATAAAIDIAEDVGIEFFATAVSQTPEVRAAIPADVVTGIRGQVEPGETMASSEFTAMNYGLTHILSRMPAPERDRILADVRERAASLIKHEE